MLRLREARINNGLTQKEVAAYLNVTQTAVSDWERSEREPDLETITKLAKLFKVSTDYLLGRDEAQHDNDDESDVRSKMYNAKLLLEGYAQIATFPPDVKYVDMFLKFQQEARETDRGLWGYVDSDAPAQQIKTTGNYVGSINSDKYHLPGCRYAEAIEAANQIWFDSEEESMAAGYIPCGVCKP